MFKTGSFWLIFVQFPSIFYHFLSKRCKKVLIFTLIFTLKTKKSYNIPLLAIASRPIFQNFPQKPLISQLFFLFSFPFSFVLCYLSSVFRPLSSVLSLSLLLSILAAARLGFTADIVNPNLQRQCYTGNCLKESCCILSSDTRKFGIGDFVFYIFFSELLRARQERLLVFSDV
jgi:hypothetical protein